MYYKVADMYFGTREDAEVYCRLVGDAFILPVRVTDQPEGYTQKLDVYIPVKETPKFFNDDLFEV